jgi:hypothetical protein
MGILDDVTHAEDQPVVTILEDVDPKIASFVITPEDVSSLKEWIDAATDEDKKSVIDENVTKIFYSHPRFPVKSILTEIRSNVQGQFDLEDIPVMKNYYTISYSNDEVFSYTNNVFAESDYSLEESRYKVYIVLNGKLNTSNLSQYGVLSTGEVASILISSETEEITSSGEEDSLILCLTIG